MNDIQFFALVSKMREAQKKWFSTKDHKWLDESKKLEKKLDAEISKRLLWFRPESLKIAWQSYYDVDATQQKLNF